MSIYKITDFYKAAFLLASGYDMVLHERADNISTFGFEETHPLVSDVDAYNERSARIEPVMYGDAIKSLKNVIHGSSIFTSKSYNNHVKQFTGTTI